MTVLLLAVHATACGAELHVSDTLQLHAENKQPPHRTAYDERVGPYVYFGSWASKQGSTRRSGGCSTPACCPVETSYDDKVPSSSLTIMTERDVLSDGGPDARICWIKRRKALSRGCCVDVLPELYRSIHQVHFQSNTRRVVSKATK